MYANNLSFQISGHLKQLKIQPIIGISDLNRPSITAKSRKRKNLLDLKLVKFVAWPGIGQFFQGAMVKHFQMNFTKLTASKHSYDTIRKQSINQSKVLIKKL